MNKNMPPSGFIACFSLAAVVGGILFSTRHNKVELNGSCAEDPNVCSERRRHSRLRRHSCLQSIHPAIRRAGRRRLLGSGKAVSASQGDTFSETDAKRMFDLLPGAGEEIQSQPDDPAEDQPGRDASIAWFRFVSLAPKTASTNAKDFESSSPTSMGQRRRSSRSYSFTRAAIDRRNSRPPARRHRHLNLAMQEYRCTCRTPSAPSTASARDKAGRS